MHCSIHSLWCPASFWMRTSIFTYAAHQIAQAHSILTGYWRTILRNQSHGFPLLPYCPHFLTISHLSFLAFFAWSSWVKPHALQIIKQLILETCIASHDSVDMETLSLTVSLWYAPRGYWIGNSTKGWGKTFRAHAQTKSIAWQSTSLFIRDA